MRNMSFALTTEQIRAGTKTVTRRRGWSFLKPGDLVCAVRKGMGLKKGEKIERLATLRIVDVRREPLRRMLDDADYGWIECALEGLASHHRLSWPKPFVDWFAETHGCKIGDPVTRIEFEYADTERG